MQVSFPDRLGVLALIVTLATFFATLRLFALEHLMESATEGRKEALTRMLASLIPIDGPLTLAGVLMTVMVFGDRLGRVEWLNGEWAVATAFTVAVVLMGCLNVWSWCRTIKKWYSYGNKTMPLCVGGAALLGVASLVSASMTARRVDRVLAVLESHREEEMGIPSAYIWFESGKAVLLPGSYSTLDEIVKVLVARPGINIEVGGHTDSRGSDGDNLDLSKRRADAVRDSLLTRFRQVVDSQLTSVGYGERRPVSSNETADGMARNRRVEFRVVNTVARPSADKNLAPQ